ncbi:MAG: DUF4920 domain-containing protein [Bacteroidota bacterium]
MKWIAVGILFLGIQIGCFAQDKAPLEYKSFGDTITPEGALSEQGMYAKYQSMGASDSVSTKFGALVTGVCQVKGCWMSLELPNGEGAMVRFKDYGFFVPTDVVGRQVVVDGTAFVEEISVEDQKHYARDGGASEEEVAKIVEPLKTYGFEAIGVLLAE